MNTMLNIHVSRGGFRLRQANIELKKVRVENISNAVVFMCELFESLNIAYTLKRSTISKNCQFFFDGDAYNFIEHFKK